MNRAMRTPTTATYRRSMDLATLAGMASTALFAAANFPMLAKAIRTRDMTSYSFTALLVGNAANVVHTVYVLSLPIGPIWVLHGFYLLSMAVMIGLYLRHGRSRATRATDAAVDVRSGSRDRIGPERVAPTATAKSRTALPCRHA